MSVLEMTKIHKSFGSLEVLKGIDLEVKKGEVVGIIGPSGGGKSTLLRCATTLEQITSGKIVIAGETLVSTSRSGLTQYTDKKKLKEIRGKFGLVFQNFNLFPHFSVRRNITESLIHVHKKSREEADEICNELLKKLGMADKANAYPCNLSGGQQQLTPRYCSLTSPRLLLTLSLLPAFSR